MDSEQNRTQTDFYLLFFYLLFILKFAIKYICTLSTKSNKSSSCYIPHRGNLVLRHSVSHFRRILNTMRVKWRNSTPRFASIPEWRLHAHLCPCATTTTPTATTPFHVFILFSSSFYILIATRYNFEPVLYVYYETYSHNQIKSRYNKI